MDSFAKLKRQQHIWKKATKKWKLKRIFFHIVDCTQNSPQRNNSTNSIVATASALIYNKQKYEPRRN